MYELTIRGAFAAAHCLRGYDGPCSRMHGHTWRVEVTVGGEELDAVGLVMDFKDLKTVLREVLAELDHVCLNDLPVFREVNPSSENIARHIYRAFADRCAPISVRRVRVWESDTAGVTYFE